MGPVIPWRDRDDPQSAAAYEERTTAAVAQILGSFRDKFVVIGGAVPWLLLDNDEMRHVGTLDVDLGLHAEALGDGEYAKLVDDLKEHGYKQDANRREFQLVRQVAVMDDGPPIDVVVDFLMP